MRIEYGNPYYNAGQNSARQPEKIKVEVTPLKADKLQPSAEAAQLLKNESQNTYGQLRQQFEIAGEQTKAEKDKLEIMLTCMEIARRISGGDNVPSEDHKFLMKHDFALYARSILQRFPKSNPHEYKRLSKDEDCRDGFAADAFKQSFTNALESCRGLSDVLAQGIATALQ